FPRSPSGRGSPVGPLMPDLPDPHENVLQMNVRAARIARVYAEALLAVAARDGQAEEVGAELDGLIRNVLGKDSRVASFFASPAISRRTREPILTAALGGNVSPLVANFLGVLNQNNRLDLLRAV